MTRRVLRFVEHVIRRAPEEGVAYEVFCSVPGCGAGSGPRGRQEAAQDWALRHTGRSSHDVFRRVVTDHARVTRTG